MEKEIKSVMEGGNDDDGDDDDKDNEHDGDDDLVENNESLDDGSVVSDAESYKVESSKLDDDVSTYTDIRDDTNEEQKPPNDDANHSLDLSAEEYNQLIHNNTNSAILGDYSYENYTELYKLQNTGNKKGEKELPRSEPLKVVHISPERTVNEVQSIASAFAHNGIIASLEMSVNTTIIASENRVKRALSMATTKESIDIVLEKLVKQIAGQNYAEDKKKVAKIYVQLSVNGALSTLMDEERKLCSVIRKETAMALAKQAIGVSLGDMVMRIIQEEEAKVENDLHMQIVKEAAIAQAEQAIFSSIDLYLKTQTKLKEDCEWQVIARACAESAITSTLENLVSTISPLRLLSMAYAENAVATVFSMLEIQEEYRLKPRPSSPENMLSYSIVSSTLNYTLWSMGFTEEEGQRSRPRSPERTAANAYVGNAIVVSLSKVAFDANMRNTFGVLNNGYKGNTHGFQSIQDVSASIHENASTGTGTGTGRGGRGRGGLLGGGQEGELWSAGKDLNGGGEGEGGGSRCEEAGDDSSSLTGPATVNSANDNEYLDLDESDDCISPIDFPAGGALAVIKAKRTGHMLDDPNTLSEPENDDACLPIV